MIDSSQVFEEFRKNGLIAFCPNCGTRKSQARSVCKICKVDPRQDNRVFARSMLMSTEEWYQHDHWKDLTPEENKTYIEREILPEIISKAEIIRRGGSVTFDKEDYWTQRIAGERKQRMPMSAACIIFAMWGMIIAVSIAAVKYFFF